MKDESDQVYDKAAELFAVLSTPVRLRIIIELCQGEKNVGQLLGNIGVAQPNMSTALSNTSFWFTVISSLHLCWYIRMFEYIG